MLVVVDVGNTRIKFGAFDGPRLVATECVEGGARVARGTLPFPHVATADEVVLLTSAPGQVPDVIELLGRPARILGEDVQIALPTTYERPIDLGVDRFAAAFGARELVGGGPVVAVDTGTASTVDALDAEGRLVALAIGPGLGSAADGLRRSAPHLPPAPRRRPVEIPADSTEASLAAGFLLGMAGLLDRLVAEAREVVGAAAPAVLTGGGGEFLSAYMRSPHRHEPDAVLHGIRVLHEMVPA